MFSKIYNYQTLGKVYHYHAFHSFKMIDLIDDECVRDEVIELTFTLKLIGKNSSGGSIFDLTTTEVLLSEEVKAEIPSELAPYFDQFQRIPQHLILRLTANGMLESIENIAELKERWIQLKNQLLQLPQQEEVTTLLSTGESIYEGTFEYERNLKTAVFYRTLFPAFHNSYLENDTLLSTQETTSAILPNLILPVSQYFTLDEKLITISTELEPDENFNEQLANQDPDLKVDSFFYNNTCSYTLDNDDFIAKAELIKMETLNGEAEVIDHIVISKIED